MVMVFNEPTCLTCGQPSRLCRCKKATTKLRKFQPTTAAKNADRDMLLETTINWIENSCFASGVKRTPGVGGGTPMLD